MMEYPFDCPACDQRYWRENSIVWDEEYDDHICHHCSDELQAERREIAHVEKGDTS